jgi:hypothetical protein
MTKTIELEYEQIDAIVLSELKESLEDIISGNNSSFEVDAFLHVIKHFSEHYEFECYKKSLNLNKTESSGGSITIDDIVENTDGSANITFSTSNDQLNVLAGEGLKFLLMKAALGASDDDIMRAFKSDLPDS